MNFMKYRIVFIGVLIVTILASAAIWMAYGLNEGVDFTGGTNIRFPVNAKVTTAQVERALNTPELGELDLKLASPQPYDYVDSQGNQRYGVLVKTRFLNNEEQKLVVGVLEEAFGEVADNSGLDIYGVDPFMGAEMLRKAFYAVIIACFLILIYVGIRFEFKSGVASVVALIHDVLLVFGIFALMQKEINSTFIAAILTIIGYSINDTIVVFDRIRENQKFRRKGEGFDEVVNNSLLQTMRRSLSTSVTTILAVMALYLLGSPSIKDFCFAVIIGLLAGTYSSIFVASPIWATWKNWEEQRKLAPKAVTASSK